MVRNRKNKHNYKFIGLILLSLCVFGLFTLKNKKNGDVKSAEIISFTPVEIDDVLVNPYMGPAPRAYTNPNVSSSLVFNYVSWKDLEPVKGVIDFTSFETKNKLDYWASKNVKMIFRFHMDYPGTVDHIDIPEWLYQEINGDGQKYNKAVDGSYGVGFSPNYNNPKIIQYHRELIRKLGERYNNDPRIAFIELGSLGHWAEWHTVRNDKITIQFPGTSITDQYVQPYLDYFSNKKLLMRRLLPITKANNMGLFNDEYGNFNQTYTWWLNRINSPYFDTVIKEQMPSWPDYWKNNIVGGENTIKTSMTTSFQDVLKAAKDIHLTYTKSTWPLSDPATKANVETLYKTIGYRFVVQSASINNNITPGEIADVNISINNKGVAPFYYNWPIELSLIDKNGLVAYKTNISEDIKTWMPGVKTFSTKLTIPKTINSGTYSLAIAVIDPEKNIPGVYFANEGRDSNGRYLLGKFNIIPTPTPTLKPTIVPTKIPTPTLTPTKIPTPTSIPTLKPTIVPTLKPTIVPTLKPSPVVTSIPVPVSTPIPIINTVKYKAEFWNYSNGFYITIPLYKSPAFTTTVNAINFNWGYSSPNSRIKADKFIARFTSVQQMEGGKYVFTTTSDDGVKLYIDDKLVIDNWTKHSPQMDDAYVYLLSGEHKIRLEYFEYQGQAVVRMGIKKL